jgi:hypothetical protein
VNVTNKDFFFICRICIIKTISREYQFFNYERNLLFRYKVNFFCTFLFEAIYANVTQFCDINRKLIKIIIFSLVNYACVTEVYNKYSFSDVMTGKRVHKHQVNNKFRERNTPLTLKEGAFILFDRNLIKNQ